MVVMMIPIIVGLAGVQSEWEATTWSVGAGISARYCLRA